MAEGAGLIVDKNLPVNTWDEFLDYVRSREQPLRIGYKIETSVQNLIFEQALMETGIPFSASPDDSAAKIRLVNLHGAKNLIPAMENELIDGFVIMQPFLALAQTRGSGKLIALLRDLPPEHKWRGHPCCALAANDAFVQSHGLVAEAMTSLMLRANRFIVENPEESARQIAHWLGLPAEVEAESLPTIKFTAELDKNWDNGIDFWIESMIEGGLLKGKIKDAYTAGGVRGLIYDKDTYERAREQTQ
jgi:NitT/TauT family transport system substrate-binding protein